ncbi:response regulator [Schleiferia thermophila]|uniref:histidine kinase n=1 Tax=Schleiferia thermophila TaxID=884107 RepID=A0A369AB78_9FLAO|nr:response regulator [Schleiferia thermophila]RCX05648.1 PAS domain S-box-containing protein [Schleiferia thermophila]GCD78863.1 hypothetical protein JCM30197_01100 [Schleiferia thermophila]
MNETQFLSKLLRSYSFFAAITVAFYTPIIYLLGIREVAFLSSILVMFMLLSYYFSKVGKYNISRIIFFTSIAGVILFSITNRNYLNGVSLYIFPLLAYIYVLTLNDEKNLRRSVSLIVMITFLLIAILLFFKTDIQFTTEYKLFYILNYVFSFLLISYLLGIIALKNYRKEKSLLENQANIITIIYTIPQLVLQIDKEYKITTTNYRFSNIVRSIFNKSFTTGDSIFDFSFEEDKDRVKKAIDMAYAGQQTIVERKISLKNNTELWIKLHYLPVDIKNSINSVLLIVSDETEHKNLLIQTKKLAGIAEESPIPIVEIDSNGKIVYANIKFIADFSLNIDQYVPHQWMDFVIDCFEHKSEVNTYEFQHKNKYYKFYGRIDETSNNLVGYLLDLTNQIEINKQLVEQKEFYDTILDHLPSDVAVLDKEFKYIFVNKYAIKDENRRKWIIGKTDYDYFKIRNLPVDIFNQRNAKKSEVIEKKCEVEWIEQFNVNGEQKFHLRKLKPILDVNNEILFILGYGTDITSQKIAEVEVNRIKFMYEEILNNLPVSIFLKNTEGKYFFGNNLMLSYINKTREEILGKLDHEIYPKELAEEYRKSDLIAIEQGEYKYEQKLITPWGNEYILAGKKLIKIEQEKILILGYSLDITDKVIFQEELRKQKELMQKILDISPTLIYIKRKDGSVYLANKATADLFGFSDPSDIVNKNAQQLGAVESELVVWTLNDERVFKDNKLHVFEETFTKNNETKWFLTYKIPFEIQNQESGLLCVGVEITDLKTVQSELTELNHQANESAKAKSLFLSNMSHEIRTPLNAIIGFCELLMDENLDEKSKEYTNTILFSARSLLNLVNDILDYSKITDAKFTLKFKTIHLFDFFENIYKMFSIWAKKKNIFFKIEHDYDKELLVYTDVNVLHQIFNNLISNAIKFTKVGGVRVYLRVDGNQLMAEIHDTGIGISEDFKPKMFKTFEQEYREFNKEFQGTGLGLALTKKFVELLQGELSYESTKDVGSIFYLKIPIQIEDKDKNNLSDTEIEINSVTDKSTNKSVSNDTVILIVEDNIINQRLLGNILSKYGYKFDVAGNGKEAIEKATVNRYDLILMDLHMPVMDGFTCLEYIRSSNNLATTKHVKVAAVTADVMPETMERCKSAGFDMVIKKPMDLYQLINILKSLADDSTN